LTLFQPRDRKPPRRSWAWRGRCWPRWAG
jgi:hypothetical protein